MSECTPMATPMEEGIRLHLNMEEDFVNATEYQSLVGSLIYLTNTHPDIAYSVSCLNRFMAAPQHPHLKAARKVLSYIKGTISYGTFIPNQADNTLMGYVDFRLGKRLGQEKIYNKNDLQNWRCPHSLEQQTAANSCSLYYGSRISGSIEWG